MYRVFLTFLFSFFLFLQGFVFAQEAETKPLLVPKTEEVPVAIEEAETPIQRDNPDIPHEANVDQEPIETEKQQDTTKRSLDQTQESMEIRETPPQEEVENIETQEALSAEEIEAKEAEEAELREYGVGEEPIAE